MCCWVAGDRQRLDLYPVGRGQLIRGRQLLVERVLRGHLASGRLLPSGSFMSGSFSFWFRQLYFGFGILSSFEVLLFCFFFFLSSFWLPLRGASCLVGSAAPTRLSTIPWSGCCPSFHPTFIFFQSTTQTLPCSRKVGHFSSIFMCSTLIFPIMPVQRRAI